MVGWLMIVLGLGSLSSAGGGAPQQPLPLGVGATVTPVKGWVSAADVWDVGPGGISLRRSGALVAFAAEAFDGGVQRLLDEQIAGLEGQFGSLRTLPAASARIDGGLPALKVLFSGTADSARLEGEIVAAQSTGVGVVMVAVAPAGQIAQVQSDLDAMLGSVVLPR